MHSYFDMKNRVVYNLSHNRRMQIDKRIYILLLKAQNTTRHRHTELYSSFGVRTCAAHFVRVLLCSFCSILSCSCRRVFFFFFFLYFHNRMKLWWHMYLRLVSNCNYKRAMLHFKFTLKSSYSFTIVIELVLLCCTVYTDDIGSTSQ